MIVWLARAVREYRRNYTRRSVWIVARHRRIWRDPRAAYSHARGLSEGVMG